jgi:hypothetical protein
MQNMQKQNQRSLQLLISGEDTAFLYYYDDKIIFQQEPDYAWLKEFLKKGNTVVIVKIKIWKTSKKMQNTKS